MVSNGLNCYLKATLKINVHVMIQEEGSDTYNRTYPTNELRLKPAKQKKERGSILSTFQWKRTSTQ